MILINFHSSVALQRFVGPCPFLQFRYRIYTDSSGRQDSLDGGSARRKAANYTQNNTNRINAHTQTSMPRVGFEHTIPAFQRAKTVPAIDRATTVPGAAPYGICKYYTVHNTTGLREE
jgi:hypothetical protein